MEEEKKNQVPKGNVMSTEMFHCISIRISKSVLTLIHNKVKDKEEWMSCLDEIKSQVADTQRDWDNYLKVYPSPEEMMESYFNLYFYGRDELFSRKSEDSL